MMLQKHGNTGDMNAVSLNGLVAVAGYIVNFLIENSGKIR